MGDREQIVAQYKAAYLRARGRKLNIEQRGSWYACHCDGITTKHRLNELKAMTQSLFAMPAYKPF